MERRFDVAVLGSGSAGSTAALRLCKAGRTVAIIDQRPFGGTCALRGCDPKKVLVAAAQVAGIARRWADLGVLDRAPAINWQQLMRFKRTFTDPVPKAREQTYRETGIAALHGRATFIDAHTLAVGEERLHATHVVIATGATHMHVAQGDDALLTSETFLELETLPETLLFLGGGYIAFELAHVAARAGSHVVMLNDNAHPLGGFDQDAVARLVSLTRSAGIEIHLEIPVERVERCNGAFTIHARGADGPRTFAAANGVLAAGRSADVGGLNLEAAGVQYTKKGVKVNEHLQSVSAAHIYAAGDAADGGGLPLTPVAGSEGEVVAQNILEGNTRTMNFSGLVSMVYTMPPLGTVGVSERHAREGNLHVDVFSGDMSSWYSTRHAAAPGAYYKTVLEKDTGKILGATILGPHAEEQLNVFALAIREGLDARAVSQTLFAYPTGSSDLEYLLE